MIETKIISVKQIYSPSRLFAISFLFGFCYHCLMQKSILTVVGKDRVGIIATLCTYLAKENINILDISQTIVDGFFNMMLICDTNESGKPFLQTAEEIEKLGVSLGVSAKLQREDIFTSMQRI